MTLYQQLRAAGRSLHSKALDAARGLGFSPGHVAKRMTLPTTGRTLLGGTPPCRLSSPL